MPTREEWILSKAASTKEELDAGDGCHLDEAICLINYLDGSMTAPEAAVAIRSLVMREADPSDDLQRLMAVVCRAFVELAADRGRLFDLVAAIQALPPDEEIDWAHLTELVYMWKNMSGLHFYGGGVWDLEEQTDDSKAKLREHYKLMGTLEAEMYVRGLGGFSDSWGFEILRLISSGRPGLDVFIGQVHAWLRIAGSKQKQNLKPDEIKTFRRGRRGKRIELYSAIDTMSNHWEHWMETLVEISQDEEYLSVEARKLAAECHALMQGETH